MNRRLLTLSLAACLAGLGPAAAQDTPDPAGQEHADRMAAEHAGDQPVASPAAADEAGEVSGERVVYATVGGREVSGYLARPAVASLTGVPVMLVIHEWWGLNENIEAMARKLAGEGYLALAVDLYGGEVATDPQQARALMGKTIDDPAPLEDNIRQAYKYLVMQTGPAKVGVIGWCFGGGWSLRTALLLGNRLHAAVIYYGRLIADPDELQALEAPVLGIFGSEDRGIPVTAVRAFETALGELGKEAEIHVYEGANHAFANPSGGRYHAQAAAAAWEETRDFLDRTLRGGS